MAISNLRYSIQIWKSKDAIEYGVRLAWTVSSLRANLRTKRAIFVSISPEPYFVFIGKRLKVGFKLNKEMSKDEQKDSNNILW